MISRTPLGIIGGVGPLASAAFARSCYSLTPAVSREQEWGRVVLDSDPRFPERSPTNFSNRREEMVDRLQTMGQGLLGLGCEQIIVCCCSLHQIFPDLSGELQSALVSLPDIALRKAQSVEGRIGILSAGGAKFGRVFESSNNWKAVSDRVVQFSIEEQHSIQSVIDTLKVGGSTANAWNQIEKIIERSNIEILVFGCTEFHLVSEWMRLSKIGTAVSIVDPLLEILEEIETHELKTSATNL